MSEESNAYLFRGSSTAPLFIVLAIRLRLPLALPLQSSAALAWLSVAPPLLLSLPGRFPLTLARAIDFPPTLLARPLFTIGVPLTPRVAISMAVIMRPARSSIL